MSVQLDARQVSSAMMGNDAASAALFIPFLARDEQIVASKYLGKRGLIIGEKCFIAVTTHRVLNLEVKWGGQLIYQAHGDAAFAGGQRAGLNFAQTRGAGSVDDEGVHGNKT